MARIIVMMAHLGWQILRDFGRWSDYAIGDIVVDGCEIGVVVKSWCGSRTKEPEHEVYVRTYNRIKTYKESETQRYMIRHKYLDNQELEWQRNAVEGV